MIGDLSPEQIDQVLFMEIIGRLGVVRNGGPYIVPVSYAFDGKYIYCHSKAGAKVTAMRENPKVCFEVSSIDNLNSWRSVLVNGEYEELRTEKDRSIAIKLLSARLDPILMVNVVTEPARGVSPPRVVEKKLQAVYYRIKIKEKSGRYQKN